MAMIAEMLIGDSCHNTVADGDSDDGGPMLTGLMVTTVDWYHHTYTSGDMVHCTYSSELLLWYIWQ